MELFSWTCTWDYWNKRKDCRVFYNYMDDRKQLTKFGYNLWSTKLTTYGVVQSTVYSLTYRNDLAEHTKIEYLVICACYLIIFYWWWFEGGNSCAQLNSYGWLSDNNLNLKIRKTAYMTIKRKHHIFNIYDMSRFLKSRQ